jgi:hypothetical protein
MPLTVQRRDEIGPRTREERGGRSGRRHVGALAGMFHQGRRTHGSAGVEDKGIGFTTNIIEAGPMW